MMYIQIKNEAQQFDIRFLFYFRRVFIFYFYFYFYFLVRLPVCIHSDGINIFFCCCCCLILLITSYELNFHLEMKGKKCTKKVHEKKKQCSNFVRKILSFILKDTSGNTHTQMKISTLLYMEYNEIIISIHHICLDLMEIH
jgi:hypothetical protein